MPGWQLVRRAHERGLAVHPFTFRDDAQHLDVRWRGSAAAEARHFVDLGIDGAFTDFPGTWSQVLAAPQVCGRRSALLDALRASSAGSGRRGDCQPCPQAPGPRSLAGSRKERPLEDLQEM